MSAMNDAVILGLASRSNGVIRIGDKSIGRLSKLLKAAKDGDEAIFEPFYEVLSDTKPETSNEIREEE